MATTSKSETNAFTFLWEIKNIKYSWITCLEAIQSPIFIAEEIEGTKWSLFLYPRGMFSNNFVSLSLYRCLDSKGPNEIKLNCRLAFLDKDGFVLKECYRKRIFRSGLENGKLSEKRIKVFVTDRETYLHDNTLTIQCTIWKENETPVISRHASARTVLEINRGQFVWKIDKFSSLKSDIRYKFKNNTIEFDLVFRIMPDRWKKLEMDIISFNKRIKMFSFKISIVNSEGKVEEFEELEYFSGELKKGIFLMPRLTTFLIDKKPRYFPKNVLLLDCECVFSNGVILEELKNLGTISPQETKKKH